MAKLKVEVKALTASLAAASSVNAALKAQIAGFNELRNAMVQQARAEAKEEMGATSQAKFLEGSNYAQRLIREARAW